MTPHPRRPWPALLLPFLLSQAACKPSYRADRLEEAVRDICRKEYDFDASSRLVGKTLYAFIASQRLVTAELGLQKDTIEKLYDTLLTVTRVSLSTDAPVDFLVVKAKDASTGVTLTLVRYVPDIKWYFYMRISRRDFEDRGIMEINPAEVKDDPADWKDITLQDFMVRLAASRLQQKITYNPLVSAFVRVHRVQGDFKNGLLTIRMDKFERVGRDEGRSAKLPNAADEILRRVAVERIGDAVDKYDQARAVTRVRVTDDQGRVLLELPREKLLSEFKKLPRDSGDEG